MSEKIVAIITIARHNLNSPLSVEEDFDGHVNQAVEQLSKSIVNTLTHESFGVATQALW